MKIYKKLHIATAQPTISYILKEEIRHGLKSGSFFKIKLLSTFNQIHTTYLDIDTKLFWSILTNLHPEDIQILYNRGEVSLSEMKKVMEIEMQKITNKPQNYTADEKYIRRKFFEELKDESIQKGRSNR